DPDPGSGPGSGLGPKTGFIRIMTF
ncbi:unnamed protein product, partial [Rotaria sp. Silwood1]